MRPLKTLFILASTALLAACGHESVGQRFEYDDSKSYGLLAYDISFVGEPFPNFSFYLFPFDAATGTIDEGERIEMGCGFLCSTGNEEVRFYLKPIDPGNYVVGYTYYQANDRSTILCYDQQTMVVSPEAGTVNYMGELTLSMDHPSGLVMDKLEVKTHNEDHVRARLAKFPHILNVDNMRRPDGSLRAVRGNLRPAGIKVAPIKYVAFNRGEVDRADVCISNYAQ